VLVFRFWGTGSRGEARYSGRFKTFPVAKIQDKISMCLNSFKVGLVFSILSICVGFRDGGGVDARVQEVKFLVIDMVVLKA
jgi:hypothetical protein